MVNWSREQYEQAQARHRRPVERTRPRPAPAAAESAPDRVWLKRPAHVMNKTERAYATRLELLRAAGAVLAWRFEDMKLRLAQRTWYTPDFMVLTRHGTEFHEVKGIWRDDARVKWKVAAATFTQFRFLAVTRRGDGWQYEEAPR